MLILSNYVKYDTINRGDNMLYVILIIIIIILIIEKIQNKQIMQNQENDNKNNIKEIYEKKEYLLTPNELKFYKLLKNITNKLNMNLFTQVSLYEIIKCKDYKEFNRVKSKSIDFVITEKNCKIKLCIELDDISHNNTKRIERDNFINKLFKELNIKLLRIPVQNFYNLEELEKQIKESVKLS